MVKSAVRAMDAVQAWAERNGKPAVTRFVVTGASKRGWTTWLTGAVDPRVVAIAPMVIDTLNMKAQKRHALEVWGKYSEQIDDYTSRGLTEKFDDHDGRRLWKMVDPYTYRDRLTMPKLLINGTNDRYWTLDALNIYWDDLKGPKSVVYLPNAGHGLAGEPRLRPRTASARSSATSSRGRPMPELSWKHSDARRRRACGSTVTSTPTPKSAKLWVATVRRPATSARRPGSSDAAARRSTARRSSGEVARPETGYIALFGDLEYRDRRRSRIHLSTQIRQARRESAGRRSSPQAGQSSGIPSCSSEPREPMIVSWNWLTQYVRLDMPVEVLTERLALTGLNHESTTEVGGDLAIDLEVTSNRPDCLGHLGVAREIVGAVRPAAARPRPPAARRRARRSRR